MKREARDFRETAPKPVKRIPLEVRRPGLRLILIILALAVAAGAFYYAFGRLTRVEPGWTVLEADGAAGTSAAADFTLQVELGAGSEAPLTERKRLTGVYSSAARDAYTLYTTQEYLDGVSNLWYINHHPGEDIRLDERLYRSLAESLSSGNWLYLGPVYELWDSVYFSREDREAEAADPRKDPETAALAERMTDYIRAGAVSLELKENNCVRLAISPEYRSFGEEYGITRWIDFGWQKNAYIADDMAEALTAAGWDKAVLSSKDGFIRCLDGRGAFALNLFADADGRVKQAALAEYRGPGALMMLLPSPGGDRSFSYRYRDGTLRTPWISTLNGLDAKPVNGLAVISKQEGCASLLQRFLDCLTREDTAEDQWKESAGEDCAVWTAEGGVLSTPAGDLFRIAEAASGQE